MWYSTIYIKFVHSYTLIIMSAIYFVRNDAYLIDLPAAAHDTGFVEPVPELYPPDLVPMPPHRLTLGDLLALVGEQLLSAVLRGQRSSRQGS